MKSKFGKIVYAIFIITLVIAFACSVAPIAKYAYNRMKENRILKEIEQQKQESEVIVTEEPEEITSEEINSEINSEEISEEQPANKEILPEYVDLYGENNDLYGWLAINGLEVEITGQVEKQKFSFPVMFTPEDPNFYVDKNWNKEVCYKNVGTSIFIDGRTTDDTENVIIYGHNMKDYSMFGSLKYYKERSFYEQNKYIEFDTIYEKRTYEIIAVSEAMVYYDEEPAEDEYLFYEHVELDSKEAFDEYVKNVKANSYYDIETTAEFGNQLITLCTCDKTVGENGRLLIVAKRIK